MLRNVQRKLFFNKKYVVSVLNFYKIDVKITFVMFLTSIFFVKRGEARRMRRFKELFIGDKRFYRMILMIAIPIMVQNGITNLVSLLDNIMVGRVGTEQMSGVAIVNQLINVFSICIFGAVSGAGIFGAQFYGKKDFEGVRNAFRFKLIIGFLLVVGWILLLITAGPQLISLFLHEGTGAGNMENTFGYGMKYLHIMLIGMVPYTVTQTYASTLRETGETILPMKAGVAAVFVNLILDYIFIFGKLGLPAMGVSGAAIATVIARFVECGIVVFWTHHYKEKNAFVVGLYRTLKIPGALVKEITIKGMPLLLNETLWSIGMAFLVQCYSTRGLAVVAGLNIATTVSNLFNVVFIALGSAIAIVIGQLLGAGKMDEAVDTDRKMIFFSVCSCFMIGAILFLLAPLFPMIYNTTDVVKTLATRFIMVTSACMPIHGFLHAAYFTLRSGGKTLITFFFDSVYIWVCNIPLAIVLTQFTGLNIVFIYLCCQLIEFVKCIIGYVLVKKRVWLNNMTEVGA